MLVAERGGIMRLAEIAMKGAIHRGKAPPEKTPTGKGHHWGEAEAEERSMRSPC